MDVSKIRDGLWRWSVPHPGWTPQRGGADGWGPIVSCVYAEYDEAVVLIDPLVPGDPAQRERFWKALDGDVSRLARQVLVLVGSAAHGRSADLVAARYRDAGRMIRVVGDAAIRDRASCVLDAAFDGIALPRGLRALPVAGLTPGETAFVLDPWRAAVFSDAVIGAEGGRVRVAPPSWGVETPAGNREYDLDLRPSLRRVAEALPEILLPSHGAPVPADGTSALLQALD